MQRRSLLIRITCAIALGCLLCVGLNPLTFAETDKLTVRAMTRNMDAGTDLNYLVGATTPEQFVQAVLATVAEVEASNLPARAAQLAAEIATAKPDLIALQEVTRWSISSGGMHVYDQLELLKSALDTIGQHYRVAAIQVLTDIPVDLGFLQVRFTDQNAILVRSDLPPGHLDVLGTETHQYEYNLSFVLPGDIEIPIPNGWMAADVKIRGARFKFANTHLLSVVPRSVSEDAYQATLQVQIAQAAELLAGLGATDLPVILAGDFNSDAEVPQHDPDRTPTAGLISSSGYTDIWHYLHPEEHGYTWPLFFEDPTSPSPGPFERIDLIFSRDAAPLTVDRTGTVSGPTGVFASDHVGVVGEFDLENHRPDVPKGKK